MKEDLQWRIGDGNSIRVWTKPWLKNSETIMWHLLATTKTWTRELVTLLTMICVLGRLMKWLPISTQMMLNKFNPFLFSTLRLVINSFGNLQQLVIILFVLPIIILLRTCWITQTWNFKATGCFSGNYKLLVISSISFGDCLEAVFLQSLTSATNMFCAL